MNVKIVNLTPHAINILGEQELIIPASGQVARVTEKTEIIGSINGIPIIKKTFGNIEGLPDTQSGVIYIVSLIVAKAVKRHDVFAIGETIRNDKGQVTGAKSLAVV